MRLVKTSLVFLISIPLGVIAMWIFNFGIIDSIFMDPCYYHIHEPNPFILIFYGYSAAEGYHLSPNLFNLILTIVLGVGVGLWMGKYFLKRYGVIA